MIISPSSTRGIVRLMTRSRGPRAGRAGIPNSSGAPTMNPQPQATDDDLLSFGVRIDSARDAAQLRWLIAHASAQDIRLTAARLCARRAPNPQQVIAALGLERRGLRRDEPVPLALAQSLARKRQQGWRGAR